MSRRRRRRPTWSSWSESDMREMSSASTSGVATPSPPRPSSSRKVLIYVKNNVIFFIFLFPLFYYLSCGTCIWRENGLLLRSPPPDRSSILETATGHLLHHHNHWLRCGPGSPKPKCANFFPSHGVPLQNTPF